MTDAQQRLASLDAFRGLTIAAMILVNSAGDWNHVHPQLAHARWHGWTLADWVFPFFLFIAGVSLSLSLAARRAAGAAPPRLLQGVARRAAVIFAVGLALNLVPRFDWTTLRLPGVLQRIALCLLLAAPIVLRCSWRGVLAWIAGLLALYAAAMLAVPVPGVHGAVGAGVLEPGRDFGAWLDRSLLGGHLWSYTRSWDPEGLAGTLPALASLLFGVLCARLLSTPRTPAAKTGWMLLSGAVLVLVGSALDRWLMPINKNLWTSSYAVFTAGWALIVFGVIHGLLDGTRSARLRRTSAWLMRPLVIYGTNALFVYAVSVLLVKLLAFVSVDGGARSLKQALYAPLARLPVAAQDASLLWALLIEAAMFALAWWMWRRRWFIKA